MKKEPKKLVKRILALGLALVLVFGVLPNTQLTGLLSAFAAQETDITTGYVFTAEAEYTGSDVDLSNVTIKAKNDSNEYILAQSDYVINTTAKTFRDVGTYEFNISPTSDGVYQISDNQSVLLTIAPVVLDSCSDLTIELSAENAFYTKSEIIFPKVTVKYKDVDITNQVTVFFQYENREVDNAKETGNYSVVVSAKENTNFSGRKAFSDVYEVIEDKEDSAISFSIKNSVSDNVGHISEHPFDVYYDANSLAISDTYINTTGTTTAIVKHDVTVYTTVTDDTINGKSMLKTVSLENIEPGSTESYEMTAVSGKGNVYSCTLTANKYLKGTYRVVAEDEAGNNSYSDNLNIEIIKAAPEIESITARTFDGTEITNFDQWVNKDVTFEISVKKAYSTSDAKVIVQYSTDNLSWHDLSSYSTEDNGNLKFTYEETNSTFHGTYYFRAKDTTENIGVIQTKTLKKDKLKPSADNILVKYTSDIKDDSGALKTTGIKGLFHTIKSFFGRNQVTVDLYVNDSISGAACVTYKDNDGIEKDVYAEKGVSYYLSENEEKDIFEENESEDITNYQHFSFTVSGSEVRNTVRIKTITDEAGNVYDVEKDGEIITSDPEKAQTMIIIDDVNPTVEMKSGETDVKADKTTDNVIYFNGTFEYEPVTLTYEERFFADNTGKDGNPVKPVIELISKETSGDADVSAAEILDSAPNTAGGAYVEWENYSSIEHTITATVYLPYSTNGGEIEYVIQTSYKDGSENELANSQNGIVSSNKLILDNKAPELVSYEITTKPAYTVNDEYVEDENGTNLYRNTGEKESDVEIQFTIDDNSSYWDKEKVEFKLYRKDAGQDILIDAEKYDLNWETESNGRNHTAKVTFNGEENVAAKYYATVSYVDKAGNKMISSDTGNYKLSDGVYTSADFILDHAAPVYSIRYSDKAYRLVRQSDSSSENDQRNEAPATGYSAYYKTDIAVEIQIDEDYAVITKEESEITGINNLEVNVNGQNISSYTPDITWTYKDGIYTGTFGISKEDYYNVTVSYKDAAGNNMIAGDTVEGSETDTKVDENGKYKSTELVIDKTPPVIKVTYEGNAVNTVNSRDYFDDTVNATIEVTDNNIRNQELKDAMADARAYTIKDNENIWSTTSAGEDLDALNGEEFTRKGNEENEKSEYYYLKLSTEANYDLLIQGYEDLAGNKAIIEDYNPYLCVDKSEPTNVEFSYFASESTFKDEVNYLLHGYAFADNKLTVTASANDEIGGIHTFVFKVTDEDGNVEKITRPINPVYGASESIELPLKGEDFKGTVEVTVTDWSDNSTVKQQGQIIESSSKHSSTGSAVITTYTKPSRTVNGVDYYNTDVAFNLTLKDSYSGISSYQYTAGSKISYKDSFRDKAGTDFEVKAEQSIINEVNRNLTLSASANNQNDVKVQASYVDNAGHRGSVEQSYNIDITAPTIQVTYDNNNPANEKYYKENRTATVVITERNFDPNDVVFSITNTDGVMPSISGWTTTGTGDNTKHTARVSFTADGDYTFTVECQDLAGNKSHYGVVDEFTIDKTIPTYTVTYDNNRFQNQYYYDANRVATIDIIEHNFDASAVHISVTKDGANVTPVISGWRKNGDHNIATVSFAADGEYTFTFSGVDLADNAMTDYTMDHFVVDTENPEIEIFNIENMSANKDVVQPGIRYNDTNYDANATEVEMTGYHNGVVEMNGQRTVSNTGVEVLLDDFEHIREMDDLYTMHATVYDLAGNSSEAEVIFSVNRFGSVYTFDDATEALVGKNGKYYTNKEQDIVVYETNVDTLEFREITCNLNGELSTLKEGEDFTVSESGSQETWKQYTYKIDASNFENQGTYVLTIYSEDRAENTSDNNSKGKKVEFVVDKEEPTVLISGVEDGSTYRETEHEVTIDVNDNVLLSSVKVEVDGETIQEYNANDIEVANGRLSFDVQSKNSAAAQAMVVSAVDAAGNSFQTDGVNFWVTTNILILYFAHKGIFFVTIAGAAAVITALIGRFFLGKKCSYGSEIVKKEKM